MARAWCHRTDPSFSEKKNVCLTLKVIIKIYFKLQANYIVDVHIHNPSVSQLLIFKPLICISFLTENGSSSISVRDVNTITWDWVRAERGL
jgi:hypothetical protein